MALEAEKDSEGREEGRGGRGTTLSGQGRLALRRQRQTNSSDSGDDDDDDDGGIFLRETFFLHE